MDWFCLTKAFATGLAFFAGMIAAISLLGYLIFQSGRGISYVGRKTISGWDIVQEVAAKVGAILIVSLFVGFVVVLMTLLGLDFLTCKV